MGAIGLALFTSHEMQHQQWFAEVVIPLALPINYTWSVPQHLLEQVKIGCRVEVNLGKNKRYAGIVKSLHHTQPELVEPKEILNVLDVTPVVYDQQLKLWEWMAAYYMCTEGEVMAAALPAYFKLSSETIFVYNEDAGDDFTHLSNDEFIVAEALLIKKELKISEIQKLLEVTHVYPVMNALVQKRVCFVWEALKTVYAPKKESYILLNDAYANDKALEQLLNEDKRLKRAEKQLELLLSYLHLQQTVGETTKSELLKKSGTNEAQLKGLIDKGILKIDKRNIGRLAQMPKLVQTQFEFSAAQQNAFGQIQQSFTQKNVCLLHGVTSSGKTEIYIKLIEQLINQGKQVLYMLPEIALTSQTIRRLQKHFGGHIGVYHSKFSQNERVEIWEKVRNGEMNVVLGARSAVFLPFQNLGLIICDEEHDTSYKQMDPAPRYHARDAAIYMSSLFDACKVLLGTATPSLESYYNALQGKYALVKLLERYGNVALPIIDMVDTRKIQANSIEETILTPTLVEAIQGAINNKKQVILFQNRRGYTPYQRCNTCGWIPQCKYCDVSLTYHKYQNHLICHYCGTQYPVMNTCAVCGSHDFSQKKFGTERIEEILQEKFPLAKIGRMDMDTVRGKHSHDQLVQQFEQQRLELLVGTQMVVKGLDFENVDLVGILDADGLLSFADFRVHERAFQLMEQVSGRAGRKDKVGKVLIQTSQPMHPMLQFVQQHDYVSMYESEIAKREQFFYPPFSRIIKMSLKHKIQSIAQEAAIYFANALQNKYKEYLVGPSEPLINRIRNQYLMELLLKLPKNNKLIQQCKKDILLLTAVLHQEKRFRSVIITPNVDAL